MAQVHGIHAIIASFMTRRSSDVRSINRKLEQLRREFARGALNEKEYDRRKTILLLEKDQRLKEYFQSGVLDNHLQTKL